MEEEGENDVGIQKTWKVVAVTDDVAALAVTLLVQGVERLPSQAGVAGDAGETLHVEHLLHSDAAAAVTHHVVATAGAAA